MSLGRRTGDPIVNGPATAKILWGACQLIAKQYSRPAPPVLTRFSWLQPRLGCDEFHEVLPLPRAVEMPELCSPITAASPVVACVIGCIRVCSAICL